MTATTSRLLDPLAILKQGELREDETVADFGCGAVGYFVWPAARMVGPDGQVFAVDIQKSVLSAIQSRLQLEAFHNVEPLWGDIERPGGVRVDNQSFDLVLLVNNFSLAKHAAALAEEIRRTTKLAGRLVVVDWLPKSTPVGPTLPSRQTPEAAQALFTEHGFSFDHAFSPGPYHWGLVFRREA